jgi:hypothetical protein
VGRELEIHVCDNCSWSGEAPVPIDLSKLGERAEPGGVVPSGECPQCGALCYPQYCDVVFAEFDLEGVLTNVYGPPWLSFVTIDPRVTIGLERAAGILTRRRMLKNALRSGRISSYLTTKVDPKIEVPVRTYRKDPSKR